MATAEQKAFILQLVGSTRFWEKVKYDQGADFKSCANHPYIIFTSHYMQVELHRSKIESPEKYVYDWNNKPLQEKSGIIKKWSKDIKKNAQEAVLEISVWEERFDNE